MATSEKSQKEGKTEGMTKKEEEEDHSHHKISRMTPVTEGAYGGGMYGTDVAAQEKPRRPRASETQSADGPEEPPVAQPRHKPPPSTGDVDVDVTGQSYFQ